MVDAGKANPIHRLTIAAIAASLRNMAQIMDKAVGRVPDAQRFHACDGKGQDLTARVLPSRTWCRFAQIRNQ